MAQRVAQGSAKSGERFGTVGPNRLPRSAFDRSCTHKTTIDSGLLIPIFVDEILPGDSVNLTPAFFARMATPLKPFMDGLHLDWQFFFTPTRLVWDNFIRMMGERPDPADHNDYTIPQMVAPAAVGHVVGSLSDYLTLPTDVPDYTHSSLLHRVYALIYREWYRDENLVDPPIVDMDDGPDLATDYPLFRRGKRKDYFTGALPFAQKGDPVDLPIGTSAPLTLTDGLIEKVGSGAAGEPTFIFGASSGVKPQGTGTNLDLDTSITGLQEQEWDDPKLILGDLTGTVDLSMAVGATVNQMRTAITLQHLLERDARGGTRYREMVLSHFGVHTDDIRLMRPELLATGSTPVNVAQVEQTTWIGTAPPFTPQGNLAAFATAAAVGRGFVKNFTEHGYIMGICSIRADLTYQQGLNRMFSKLTRVELYTPDLANLGEQAVLSREIYTDGTGVPGPPGTGDFSVWGFQPRYEEYRYRENNITGQFRSTFAQSLDVWHLALDFSTRPVLNEAFIEENPPVSRVIAIPSEPEFLLDTHMKITHVRPIPKFGTPGLARF